MFILEHAHNVIRRGWLITSSLEAYSTLRILGLDWGHVVPWSAALVAVACSSFSYCKIDKMNRIFSWLFHPSHNACFKWPFTTTRWDTQTFFIYFLMFFLQITTNVWLIKENWHNQSTNNFSRTSLCKVTYFCKCYNNRKIIQLSSAFTSNFDPHVDFPLLPYSLTNKQITAFPTTPS